MLWKKESFEELNRRRDQEDEKKMNKMGTKGLTTSLKSDKKGSWNSLKKLRTLLAKKSLKRSERTAATQPKNLSILSLIDDKCRRQKTTLPLSMSNRQLSFNHLWNAQTEHKEKQTKKETKI